MQRSELSYLSNWEGLKMTSSGGNEENLSELYLHAHFNKCISFTKGIF